MVNIIQDDNNEAEEGSRLKKSEKIAEWVSTTTDLGIRLRFSHRLRNIKTYLLSTDMLHALYARFPSIVALEGL